MENKLSVSVVLPLKSSLEKDFSELFDKSIQSIKNQTAGDIELVIVHCNEHGLSELIKGYDFGNLKTNIVLWDKEPNYSSQVNFGIEKSSNEWISIFEFDDEYSSIWFKNVEKYINHYPEVDVFLPVVVDTDDKNMFAGFTNEATFAANFTQEMSYLTNETLQNYQNFQTAGAVIRKKIIQEFGGFKPSIKLTFIYEFFLRLTYNSVSIMTIPKIGYRHTNMRENSLFWNYKFGSDTLTEDEVKFWVQTAKKEYFFTDDRVIKYESEK